MSKLWNGRIAKLKVTCCLLFPEVEPLPKLHCGQSRSSKSELWSQTVGFISRLHFFLAVSSDKLYTSQRDYTKKLFVHKHVSPVAVSGIFSRGHGFWAKIQGTKHTTAKSFPKVFLFIMQSLEPSYTRHSLTWRILLCHRWPRGFSPAKSVFPPHRGQLHSEGLSAFPRSCYARLSE